MIDISTVDFEKGNGLVPAIIQDNYTNKILMLGYMNEESLSQSIDSGKVTFFSRSKNRLWTKGEESGNYLELKDIKVDCDNDTLLIKAKPKGPVCHTGSDTCWNEKNEGNILFLNTLSNIIQARKENPQPESYTSQLFSKGINKIAQKVGEEAVELVIEAKDSDDNLFLNEAADLVFHLLVLLRQKGFDIKDVIDILEKRHQ
jgi:phosphoribosyl-ATP pyrophosphohydrolase/phosphoribosyl-AMP cyclohydrolase